MSKLNKPPATPATPAPPTTPATPATPATSISMTTDFGCFPSEVTAYAAESLDCIAEKGFNYIHWCHYWTGDYVYGDSEINWIAERLSKLGLVMHDLHSPDGKDKHWGAPEAHRRRAGVELIRNRISMAAACDCSVVILHSPGDYDSEMDIDTSCWRLCECLDDLCDYARGLGVAIALENSTTDNFPVLKRAFERYPADVLGLCYDSGHGNMAGNGLEMLESCADRLLAVHLHDNDGENDQHKIPLTGTIDWPALMQIIASSAYNRPAMTMEISIRKHIDKNVDNFLNRARENCRKILDMYDSQR